MKGWWQGWRPPGERRPLRGRLPYRAVKPEDIVEQLPMGVFVKDPFSVYIACNERFAAALRATPDEIVGRTDPELFAAQAARAQRDEDRGVIETGRSRESVMELPVRGSGRWVRIAKSPYRNETGEIVGVLGYVEEVPAPPGANAEEALRESEERFAQSARQSRTVVWEIDPAGRFTYVGGAAEEVLGYRPEELVGRLHYYELHPREGREQFASETLAMLDRRETFRDFENTMVHKDGRHIWMVTNGEPMVDPAGRLFGYRGSDTDITDRKRARDALARSEELLRESQRIARVGTVEVDHKTGRHRWSAEMFRLLELDPASTTPSLSGILARVDPDDRDRVEAGLCAPTDQGEEYDLQFRLLFPDERTRHIRALGAPARDRGGSFVRSICTLQDVTKTARLREALLVRTKAMDTSITPMAIAGADGVVTYANDAFVRLWGEADADAVIGRESTSFFARPNEAAAIIERMAVDDFWTGEIDARRSDGSTFTVLVSASVVKDERGEIRYLMATYLDVTELRRADALVRDHAAKFEALLGSALDGYWFASTDGRILEVNDRATEITGFGRDELCSMWIHDLVGTEDARLLEEHLGRLTRTGSDRIRTRLATRTGKPLDIELSATLWESDGEVYFFAFFRDVTSERELAEAQQASEVAERANRAKSEFLSSMSHELRTPMNSVIGFAQLLELHGSLGEREADYVREITTAGDHLLGLINEVLDFAKIESGRMALSTEEVACAEVVEEAVSMLMPAGAEQRVRMTRHPIDEDLRVHADPVRVRQILINLLSNAIKYNRADGMVEVWAEHDRSRARILVRDTGPGIPEERLEELFVPFNRLGREAGDVEGSGIGLAFSRRLAEAMGGSVDLETVLGEGSTFWVELPVADSAPVRALVETAPPTEEPKQTVLYVEDNAANVRLVERILASRDSIRLITTHEAHVGLELAERHRPCLILLDLNLAGRDGTEVLRRIREEEWGRDIPVVAVTARAAAEDVATGRDAGFAEYLTKPLDVRRLLSVVDETTSARCDEER